jgi:uncharacterized membrane protein
MKHIACVCLYEAYCVCLSVWSILRVSVWSILRVSVWSILRVSVRSILRVSVCMKHIACVCMKHIACVYMKHIACVCMKHIACVCMKHIPNTFPTRNDVINLDKNYSYFSPMNLGFISVSMWHLNITCILCGNLMLLQEVPLHDITVCEWSATSAAKDTGPVFVRQ